MIRSSSTSFTPPASGPFATQGAGAIAAVAVAGHQGQQPIDEQQGEEQAVFIPEPGAHFVPDEEPEAFAPAGQALGDEEKFLAGTGGVQRQPAAYEGPVRVRGFHATSQSADSSLRRGLPGEPLEELAERDTRRTRSAGHNPQGGRAPDKAPTAQAHAAGHAPTMKVKAPTAQDGPVYFREPTPSDYGDALRRDLRQRILDDPGILDPHRSNVEGGRQSRKGSPASPPRKGSPASPASPAFTPSRKGSPASPSLASIRSQTPVSRDSKPQEFDWIDYESK